MGRVSRLIRLKEDEKDEEEEKAEAERKDPLAPFRRALRAKHGKNLLRGWRLEFDPDGDLHCNFLELCTGCQRINFHGDVLDLVDENDTRLSFHRVAPALHDLLVKFREWVKERWDGPGDLFEEIDTDGSGSLSFPEFQSKMINVGWNEVQDVEGTSLLELFEGFDLNKEGDISKDELAIAELDESERRTWMRQVAHEQREWQIQQLAKLHEEGALVRKNLSPAHRLANRAWLDKQMPRIPQLEVRRRRKHFENERRHLAESLQLFRDHLFSHYGNPVRMWRKVLDPEWNFKVTRAKLLHYCRKIDFPGDASKLWAALDQDQDGVFRLEEMDPWTADALAFFRRWAHFQYGGCAALWDCIVDADIGCRGHRLKASVFTWALKALRYQHAGDQVHMRLIVSAMDREGCGFIDSEDIAWLERWPMPVWLGSAPDYEGLEVFRDLLIRRYGHLLKAWRMLLDTNQTNRASWPEFKAACQKLKFRGEAAGVWAALDTNRDGWVCLTELHLSSHHLLLSFKVWADKNFGSAINAFEAIDGDGSGEVSLVELKRVCRRLDWDGDVLLLFNCLVKKENFHASNFEGELKSSEMMFLDFYGEDNPNGRPSNGWALIWEPPQDRAYLNVSRHSERENASVDCKSAEASNFQHTPTQRQNTERQTEIMLASIPGWRVSLADRQSIPSKDIYKQLTNKSLKDAVHLPATAFVSGIESTKSGSRPPRASNSSLLKGILGSLGGNSTASSSLNEEEQRDDQSSPWKAPFLKGTRSMHLDTWEKLPSEREISRPVSTGNLKKITRNSRSSTSSADSEKCIVLRRNVMRSAVHLGW